jgi:Mg2+ and Co2+ transporter CorA
VRHELAKQNNARDHSGTVGINTSTTHLFLFRDGTVLTVSDKHAYSSNFFAPIQSRLSFAHDSLRRTCDASLLVHAALDLTIDHILEVVEECRASLLELERRVLVRPTMDVVRQLHVLVSTRNGRPLDQFRHLSSIYGGTIRIELLRLFRMKIVGRSRLRLDILPTRPRHILPT